MSRDVSKAAWAALLVALVADVFLAPFYPQFFASTFGANGVVTAGLYIALCRVAVAVALPLWTRWTRRIGPLRLVARAQVIAGTAALACVFAPSLTWFLILTFIAEAARAAYLLLYPALFEAAPAEKKGAVVARVAAAFHAAALIAAVTGGVLLEHASGRVALLIAAAADFVQLACLVRALPSSHPVPAAEPAAPHTTAAAASAQRRVRLRLHLLCALTFLSTGGFVILRPHFTTYLSAELAPSAPLWLLGLVFVVPSAVAVLVLPFGQRIARSPRLALYMCVALVVMALTATGQLAATTLAILVAVRVVYGLACYVIDIAVDHAALSSTVDTYGHFGFVAAVQNIAIVLAPLAASWLASGPGWPPLFVAAGVLSALAAVCAFLLLRTRPHAPVALPPEASP
jgi:DHA1 family multidrug resistance protein-like MFS transporter